MSERAVMSGGTPTLSVRRRGAALFMVCALVEAGCIQWIDYSTCPNETGGEEGETVPPCPEAGVDDASQSDKDAAPDASMNGDGP